jgi:hypothetical protein
MREKCRGVIEPHPVRLSTLNDLPLIFSGLVAQGGNRLDGLLARAGRRAAASPHRCDCCSAPYSWW